MRVAVTKLSSDRGGATCAECVLYCKDRWGVTLQVADLHRITHIAPEPVPRLGESNIDSRLVADEMHVARMLVEILRSTQGCSKWGRPLRDGGRLSAYRRGSNRWEMMCVLQRPADRRWVCCASFGIW
jgi:hypothetical protein